jgi:AcrR family transcriptional regulator
MSATAEPGLRERKKAATRTALHEAAVRLAIEHGTERLTVEAIADEVGVSRRTFSNYFGGKEEALVYGDFQRINRLIEAVRVRPAGEGAWAALGAAAAAYFAEVGELDKEAVAQWRLVRSHPSLVSAQVQTFAALERELACEIAVREGGDPAAVRNRMMAASFLAAMRVSVHVWLDRSGSETVSELVAEALAEAGRGFGGQEERPPGDDPGGRGAEGLSPGNPRKSWRTRTATG